MKRLMEKAIEEKETWRDRVIKIWRERETAIWKVREKKREEKSAWRE